MPGGVDPRAILVMREAGVDLSGQRSKHVDTLSGVAFDWVVTVCDRAHESCPVFPGRVLRIHAGFDDPPRLAAGAATEDQALAPYRRVRDEIREFVEHPVRPAVGGRLVTGTSKKRLSVFERYLTLWVAACMAVGVALGKLLPGATSVLRRLEFGDGSQINVPIAILIWLMIYPMMLKIDFGSLLGVGRRPGGLLVTLFVNWVVKPCSMALACAAVVVLAAVVVPQTRVRWGGLLFALLPLAVGLQLLLYRVEAAEAGLRTRGLFGRHTLAWREVRSLRLGAESVTVEGPAAAVRIDTADFSADQRAALARSLARRVNEAGGGQVLTVPE